MPRTSAWHTACLPRTFGATGAATVEDGRQDPLDPVPRACIAAAGPWETPRVIPAGRLKEELTVEWIIVIVLVLLLLGALGPRAGFYGAAGALWDVLSIIIFIALVIFLLNLLGIFGGAAT
jgi:hypothetical protein